MNNRTFSWICTAFLFAVVLLQLHDANAKSLLEFQDSFDLEERSTSETEVLQTTSDSTGYASTERNEELVSPTMATTEAPLCRKKTNELKDMLEMYSKLGIDLQDVSPPACDNEGYYKPLQCQFYGCRCVDRYGKPTTKFSPGRFTCETQADFVNEFLE